MKLRYSIFLFLIALGCSKYEIETIPDNQPPGETLITTERKEGYINRLFITLAGRKATPAEFEEYLALLGEEALQENREQVIQKIMDLPDYSLKLYAVARADYLESVDTAVIRDDYDLAVAAIPNATGPALEYWLDVEEDLGKMLAIPSGLASGSMTVPEMHKIIVDNIYYDDINMGTENYVVATYQNFLLRYPTNVELENAATMVDGFSSQIFLQSGASKDDFIEIFFDTDDYYEGQVITLFDKYLFRDPTSSEMDAYTQNYFTGKDYRELQTTILSSDEYFFY